MSEKVYIVLQDFSVEIIKNKGKKNNTNIKFTVGEKPFTYDPNKEYKPSVNELIRTGKIKEKVENESVHAIQNEQSDDNEQRTSKSSFLSLNLLRKDDSKEERGNWVKNNQELLRLIDGLLEEKLGDKFSELYEGYQELREQNKNLKGNLDRLDNNHEFANTNQKIDGIAQLVQKYPMPVTLNDLDSFLKPVVTEMPEAAKNMDYKLNQLPRKIKSDFESVAENNTTKILSSVNKNSERLNQISNTTTSSISQMESKLGQLPGKIGDTVTLHLEDTSKNISRIKTMVNETKETVEELLGKSSVLDDLKGKLDKVNFSQKLEPFNREDDVVIELAEQGQLILEQLTLASRHYVAQRKEMELLKLENEKLKQEHEQIEAMTTKKVEQMVKTEVTKQLISKFARAFANLDDLYTDGKLNGVQAFFTNNGLVRSEELKLGEQITITDENRKDYEAAVTFEYEDEGQYLIEESQFVWKDTNQSFKKAKAVKIPNEKLVEETNNSFQDSTKQVGVMDVSSVLEDSLETGAAHHQNLTNETNEAAENEQPTEEQQPTEQKQESNDVVEELQKTDTLSAEIVKK
ncbi:hypothetical protein [Peribacillus kribbensis]|uniref:hypothetical protein n=1 Tax=Peribacillus kribbensis TaxID=356658 RepID=UPI0004097D13|nr:hypothetical protein [Peribacillus kribbensis]